MKNKGYSLIEMLVAVGIGGTALLLIATIVSNVSRQFIVTRERLEADILATRAQAVMTTMFSQAVDVDNSNAAIPNNMGNVPGRIINVDFRTIAGSLANWTTFAVFNRENTVPADSGGLTKVAMFYRRPDVNRNTSGVIFITQERNPGPMRPNYDENFFDRVVLLQITKRDHPIWPKTVSVDVHFQIRFHIAPSTAGSWCPEDDIIAGTAGCDLAATRRNIDKFFSIPLRNNLLHAAGAAGATVAGEERVLGNLYFFQPVLPRN